MPAPHPTAEQDAAMTAFGTGEHLVLQAGAGTGKTTTLAMLGASTPRRGLYIAFNRSIAQKAGRTFPASVKCKTAHSLAYAAVGRHYAERLRSPRVASVTTGSSLGINMELQLGDRTVTAGALSYTTLHTVIRFCQSADPSIGRQHVPWLRGIAEQHLHDQLADIVLPYAQRAWADVQKPDRGKVRFVHDHYLKMWALTEPKIPADFLLLDEAQDTNPVVEQVFNAQRGHAQLVMVGDSAQAIYGWRGARDVMTGFDGNRLTLSRSFRFGEHLAAEANRWLAIANAPIRLTGSPAVHTTLEKVTDPDAILCRSNAGTMAEVMSLLEAGRSVALVGGGKALTDLAYAARDLKTGKHTFHPELLLFSSWGELQDYAEWDPAGRDLFPLVELIDEHGVDVILDTVSRLSDEAGADITVSTTHKAKGREWSSVRIAEDFTEPEDPENVDAAGEPLPGEIDEAEARLAYVAVTRARHRLDIGGLSWINQHPDGNPLGRRQHRSTPYNTEDSAPSSSDPIRRVTP
ncbi:MAG: UvrD-helicase domain-containing protein [Pseudonocardiaceae bacterium]